MNIFNLSTIGFACILFFLKKVQEHFCLICSGGVMESALLKVFSLAWGVMFRGFKEREIFTVLG
jgi:hypothetical protein